MTSYPRGRTKVFISYSHKDARYLNQLEEHLAYYKRKDIIDSWSDKRIQTGAEWRKEIRQAIASAKVAVLFISPSFFASKFIAEDELPPLLVAAAKEGVAIFPVIVRPSNFEDTELSKFQTANTPSKPLINMSGYERDMFWVKAVKDIMKVVVPQEIQSTTSDKQQAMSDLKTLYEQDVQEVQDRRKQEILNLQKELKEQNKKKMEELVYLSLRDLLFNQRRTRENIEFYKIIGELLPEAPQLNYVLGRNFSGAGYYEDAIKALEAALSVEPNFVEAQMELGLTYRRRGDAQEGPDAEALRKTHYDQAIDHLERAIKLRSNYEDALAALGAVYRRRGDKERDLNHDAEAREYYERAREYYEQAYNADPLSSYALGNLASLSWYLKGQNAARGYFVLAEATAKVRLLSGGSSSELYWDYYDLALAQLVIGKIDNNEAMRDEAIKNYETAIKLTPGNIQFDSVLNNLYLLQKAKEHIDRLDDVIEMLKAAKS